MKYESWTERQVREAIERGEFDNLPGAGKPIPGINGREDENWWVKSFLEREQLPTTLALRGELTDLQETLADVGDEATVRQIVRDLNRRIVDAHRNPDGPPMVLKLVSVENAVAQWRASRPR